MESDHEIYPMALFPRLLVADVAESTTWYEALGFDVVSSTPVVAHVRYRKYADVMLAGEETATEGERTDTRGHGVTIYITVADESVDDVAQRAESAVSVSVEGPHDTPWNTREVVVADPDGYEFAFAEQRDADRSFEDVVGTDADDA